MPGALIGDPRTKSQNLLLHEGGVSGMSFKNV